MPGTSVQKATNNNSLVGGVQIDYEAVLKTLNLNPRDAATQALVLTCERYDLDPVLRHMVLIQGTPYVTHKGLWHIAHRSGELDGEEVLEQGETDREWHATVGIYRKGWAHPITMTGRYPKSSSNKHYGPEMAVVRAECLVLRRLFDVAVPVQEERDWERESTPAPERTPHKPIEAATGELVTNGESDEHFGPTPTRSTRRPPPSQNRRPSPSRSGGDEPDGNAVSAAAPSDEAVGAPGSVTGGTAAAVVSEATAQAFSDRLNAIEGQKGGTARKHFRELFESPAKVPVSEQEAAHLLIAQYEPQ